jgi:hypothetical protein
MAPRSRGRRPTRRARRGVVGSLLEGATDVVQNVAKDVVPGVVGAIDVDDVVQRIDVQAIIERVDFEAVLERIDLNAALQRVDIEALLNRLDVDALIARVDLDQLAAKLDINALVERIDVDALVGRTELGSIITRSGAGVAGEVLDALRSQGVGLDSFVHRWADRLLRRGLVPRPDGPPLLMKLQRPEAS